MLDIAVQLTYINLIFKLRIYIATLFILPQIYMYIYIRPKLLNLIIFHSTYRFRNYLVKLYV